MAAMTALLTAIGLTEEVESAFARLAWEVVCSPEVNEEASAVAAIMPKPPRSLAQLVEVMCATNSCFSLRTLDAKTRVDADKTKRDLQLFLRTSLRSLAASAAAGVELTVDEDFDALHADLGIFDPPSHVHGRAYEKHESSKAALGAQCRADAREALALVCIGSPSAFASNLYAGLLTEVAGMATPPTVDDKDGARAERIRKDCGRSRNALSRG